jgi:ribosomal protein S18 acetylase RimI-like enzyme
MVIRPAQRTDAHSMACIYVQTWRDTYLSIVPYGYLSAMSIPQHERAFLAELTGKHTASFVAEESDRVIGFTTGGYERNGDDIYSGEIYTLYVLKNLQRQGIGAKLVSALAGQFNQFGIYSMLVRVLKLNPYRRFYIKNYGTYLETKRLPFADEIMDIETYGWLDTTLVDD